MQSTVLIFQSTSQDIVATASALLLIDVPVAFLLQSFLACSLISTLSASGRSGAKTGKTVHGIVCRRGQASLEWSVASKLIKNFRSANCFVVLDSLRHVKPASSLKPDHRWMGWRPRVRTLPDRNRIARHIFSGCLRLLICGHPDLPVFWRRSRSCASPASP